MAEPDFEAVRMPTSVGRKSAWNIYTVLLIIALVALWIAMGVLFFGEIKPYGGFGVVGGPVS
jgi:ABC-type multidrug transport system permease subunit